MMTTETRSEVRAGSAGVASAQPRVLLGTAAVTAAVSVAVLLVALLVSGPDGLLGAAVGAATVLVVLSFGCATLAVVARVLPSATLLVALVTYLAQAAVLLLVFVRISEVDVFSDGPGRTWLALGLVAATLAWMTAQLLLTLRARMPYYDLADESSAVHQAGGRR
jgi:ATP synthase protein I